VLGLDFLNDKVGIDMIEKKPNFTSGHSCLESRERLNMIGSPNFRCFVGLSCCGSGFLTPKGPRGVFLKKCSKSAISSSRSKNENFHYFSLSTVGSCPRRLGEQVQKVL
jgi:hypothetical protein